MKKYTFLLKPVFYIFNLLFATWLVFYIEKISPSDFGKYKYIFEDAPVTVPDLATKKKNLKKICIDYKTGAIDSIGFEKQLNEFFVTKNGSSKGR